MSEFGGVDDLFDEMVKLAEQLMEQSIRGELSPRGEELQAMHRSEPDEVITGQGEVTYLLQAPGYASEDFLVSVFDDAIEVKTNDFMRKKILASIVYPESAVTTYRNGVLSVRMKRRGA